MLLSHIFPIRPLNPALQSSSASPRPISPEDDAGAKLGALRSTWSQVQSVRLQTRQTSKRQLKSGLVQIVIKNNYGLSKIEVWAKSQFWHFMIYCYSDHLLVQDWHSRTKTLAQKFSPAVKLFTVIVRRALMDGDFGKFLRFLGIQYISWENIYRSACVLVKWIEDD